MSTAEASAHGSRVRLLADDLIPDHALKRNGLDAFEHGAIASRLADLVAESSTPVNVALFGPWGSGKSSVYELLRRSLLGMRRTRVRLVRYDAWKFGGQALQRNFISHAANELGFREKTDAGRVIKKNRAFHRGLYERQRRAEVDFTDFDRKNLAPVFLFFGAFLIFVLLFAVVAGGASLLTDENFLGQIGNTLPGFLVPAGIIGAVVAAGKAVLDGTTVDIEQSQPSADEEFGRVFAELRDRALRDADRLVFFVDELDRCAPKDVVATLTALRTFLDQEQCVFVVAADREVLESALAELPQATPFNEENPYYSSASSFLDKVFQHQLPLPPLRGQRLTRYARDLVLERGGVWAELRSVEARGRRLDGVVYALIPGHVRSPRRVKVLLNNFATNVRIAESRGVDWQARAREIAKLTVLQTEFPLLAADLHHEPRLPSFILDPPPWPSERVKRLLDKHQAVVPPAAGATPEPVETDALEDEVGGDGERLTALTDVSLIEGTDEQTAARREALSSSQRRQLMRYLERVEAAGIPDPGRDLLYLEAAGAAVGFADSERGEVVENDAPEAPRQLIRVSRGWPVEERQAAVRLLADMADQEFGDERANVVAALLGIARGLDNAVDSVGEVAVESVKGFLQEQALSPDLLTDALNLAVRTETGDNGPLTEKLLIDNQLFADSARTAEVASMLDVIPSQLRPLIYGRVAEALAYDDTVLSDPVASVSGSAALALLNEPSIQGAVREQDEARIEMLARHLFEAVDARDGDSARDALYLAVQSQFAREAIAYDIVRERAPQTLPLASVAQRAELALTSLTIAPPSDWSFWARHIESVAPEENDALPELAVEACQAVVAVAEMSDEEQREGLGDVFAAAAPHLDGVSEDEGMEIAERLGVRLEREWWADDTAFSVQAAWHGTAHVLRERDSPSPVVRHVDSTLLADLQRGLDATTLDHRGVSTPAATEPLTLRGIEEWGSHLLPESAEQLLQRLDSVEAPEEEERRRALAIARIAVSTAAAAGGASVDIQRISRGDVRSLLRSRRDRSRDSAAAWIRLGPAFDDVVNVLARVGFLANQAVRDAASDWAQGLDEPLRTAALEAILAEGYPAVLVVRVVAQHGYDESLVLDRLLERTRAGTRANERTGAIDLLLAVAPESHVGQKRVADTIVLLLARNTKVDFRLACEAAAALGTQHRSARRVKDAFVTAARSGHYVEAKYLPTLASAGIKVPQKAVAKKGWDAWRGIFRRGDGT